MSLCWEITEAAAKIKATEYSKRALELKAGTVSTVEALRFSAYFAGYMENAAERESLRVINERLHKELESYKTINTTTTLEASPATITNDLEGLI